MAAAMISGVNFVGIGFPAKKQFTADLILALAVTLIRV
jgi:hypothetical protein